MHSPAVAQGCAEPDSPPYLVPVLPTLRSPHRAANILRDIVSEIGSSMCCEDFVELEAHEELADGLPGKVLWLGAWRDAQLSNTQRDEKNILEALREAAWSEKKKGQGRSSCERKRLRQQNEELELSPCPWTKRQRRLVLEV